MLEFGFMTDCIACFLLGTNLKYEYTRFHKNALATGPGGAEDCEHLRRLTVDARRPDILQPHHCMAELAAVPHRAVGIGDNAHEGF